ncbi:MAG: GNAT family N-acetyltransferase [Chloroflexi bacterium]|nr:GNAT family N-acetyltransferase [Chloroflexota bacterium]
MTFLVRAAKADDIDRVAAFDHSYSTEFVWQMDLDDEGKRTGAQFREARLPRKMTVGYPRPVEALAEGWEKRAAVLVAEKGEALIGYLCVDTSISPGAAWVTDLAVDIPKRRQGAGSQLVLAAQKWAKQQGLRRIVLEMQSKNHPAIRLAQKLAFEFSGYHDRYYPNQDIAIFFAKSLS